MDGGSENLENNYTATLTTVTEGEWAGWSCYPGGDPFEDLAGQFYFKTGEDGRPVCAFRAERKHMNGGGFMHGGCFLTFADYSCFAIAEDQLQGPSVTVNLSGDFLSAASVGDVIESTGEVTRAGGRLIYVRGLVTANGKPALSFTSVITRVRRDPPKVEA